MEREPVVKTYSEEQMLLLTRFNNTLIGLRRDDIDEAQALYLFNRHQDLAQECIDNGLIEEMVKIRDHSQKQEIRSFTP